MTEKIENTAVSVETTHENLANEIEINGGTGWAYRVRKLGKENAKLESSYTDLLIVNNILINFFDGTYDSSFKGDQSKSDLFLVGILDKIRMFVEASGVRNGDENVMQH